MHSSDCICVHRILGELTKSSTCEVEAFSMRRRSDHTEGPTRRYGIGVNGTVFDVSASHARGLCFKQTPANEFLNNYRMCSLIFCDALIWGSRNRLVIFRL